VLFQADSARLMGLPDNTPSFTTRDRVYAKNLDTGYVFDIGINAGAPPPTSGNIGQDVRYVGDGWLLSGTTLTDLAPDAASRLPNLNLLTREDGTVASVSSLFDWLGGDHFRVTTSANLVLADTDGFRDHYLVEIDRTTGDRTITLLGSAGDGTPGLTDSFPNAYPTDIPNIVIIDTTDALVADDTDGLLDAYFKNVVTDEVTLLDRDFTGASGSGSSSVRTDFLDGISQARLLNGKLLFTTSTALVAGDTDGVSDVYLLDASGGSPILLDVATDGSNGNGNSGNAFQVQFLTPEWVRFASTSTNLVPGVGNGTDSFVYLKNLVTGVAVSGQTTEAGTPFAGVGSGNPFSSNGQLPGTIAGQTLFATNQKLSESDLNGLFDEYLLNPLSNIVPWTQGLLAEVTLSASFAGATGATFTWGDGGSDTAPVTGGSATATHQYAAGTYTAEVSMATPGGPLAGSITVIAGALIDTGGGNSILVQGVTKAQLAFTDFDAPRPNVAPVAVADSYTVFGTSPLVAAATGSFGTFGFLNSDRDEFGGTLSVLSVETPGVGTLVSQASGAFTYTAPAGFFGTVEFGYVVTDGTLTANGTLRMNVVASQSLDAVNDLYAINQSSRSWWVRPPACW
jgi:hypothetical protein